MYFHLSLASTVLLAGNALAQYAGGYNYDSGSGNSQSGASGSSGTSDSLSVSMPMSTSVATPSAAISTATPSSGQVMVHVVKVSNKKGSLTFEPNNLQVPAGHMVQFHFYPKNHSVVQSTFDQPCQPIKNNNASVNGFFSGFMPVKPDAAMMPSYTIKVNDTKPIWYYCSQGKHCQDGMVGVINPPAANKSRTIESFTALANKATENLSPGQQSLSTSSTSSSGSSTSGSGNYYGSGSYGSSGSSAAAPADSGSTSSGTVTMPLPGTNSTSGAAAPSGSTGGQSPAAFVPGSGAAGLRSSLLYSLGVVGIVISVSL
ncbi:MAG: hypothetical protein L6R40_001593 [Gallowayella cf. fulva]|nr:MAG: hypothetical protein L6R40_001593 [Xanthomendoza cf. fulva]